MVLDIMAAVFYRLFTEGYDVLNQYLIANLLAFVRGFEVAIVVMIAAIFLIVTVSMTIRQVRKLPKSYVVHIVDLDGRETTVDGIRQIFATYDVAESYARLYRSTYPNQYRFRVIGRTEGADRKFVHGRLSNL